MSHRYLLGVDLGTSATKAALYRTDGLLCATADVAVPLHTPRPGVVEQESDDFYTSAAQAVQRTLRDSGVDARAVVAVAFDSQMAGLGTIDEAFRPATRFDSWLDMRCEPYIRWMDETLGDEVTRRTGCAPTCDHGPKMLWWKHEWPDEYARIARFVMPAGYVAGRLAGLRAEDAFIDYTFLHFSGLSDAEAGAWSPELLAATGVDADKLPRIVEPWHVVGGVTDDAARDFGLAPGTLVAAGCGDTAAGALGAGIVRPGMLFDLAGTASVLAGCTDTFVADTRHRALLTMRSVIPGLWHPLAYIGGGGQALRWFRDTFPLPAGDASTSGDLYDRLSELAAIAPPGSDGLYFSPHLGGRICPAAPHMRGAWLGFSWSHTQAHFFRALLESVAYEYAWYLEILREALPALALTEARVLGGGARSATWNQIKADVLGVPYVRLTSAEGGTWGAAQIAGKAAGLYDDLATVALAHATVEGEPIVPDAERHAAYRPLVARHIELQRVLDGAFAAIA
jgi:xylulokinase